MQVDWVLDYLPDVTSDLSAIHGIRDVSEMEAAVFFTLAWRLPAYAGVMAQRLAAETARDQRQPSEAPAATPEVLAQLNAQLGRREFGYTRVPADA